MVVAAIGISEILVGFLITSELFLISSGLTIIYGALRILNLAHASFYMIGAYIAVSTSTIALTAGLPMPLVYPALVAAGLSVGILGLAIEPTLIRPIYQQEEIIQLLLTFGILYVFEDIVKIVWGIQFYSVTDPYLYLGLVEILGTSFPAYGLLVIAVTMAVAIIIWFILFRTRLGIILRATVSDREMAGALGVNVKRLYTQVFALGAAFAGMGGALMTPLITVFPGMGLEPLILSFVVVVIGGLGSVKGALVGSLIVGMVSSVGIALFPELELALIFIIMLIILAVRPAGLFGSGAM